MDSATLAELVFSPSTGDRLGACDLDALLLLGAFLGGDGLRQALGRGDLLVSLGFNFARDRLGLELGDRDTLLLLSLLLPLIGEGFLLRDADITLAVPPVASPTAPSRSCSATSTLARLIASAAARLPIASM